MAWKTTFDIGVASFKKDDLEQALFHIDQAADTLQNSASVIYDLRATVHEKLGNLDAALRDAEHVIDLTPDRWQGYARSARLFDSLGSHASVIEMVDQALNRLRENDTQRRTPLVKLRKKAVVAQAAADKVASRTSNLLGMFPVETLVQIFTILIDEDHTWSVKLSHVCGHWHRILANTPSAWRTLVLSKTRPVQKAKLWKQRSNNRITRLSVSISGLDRAFAFAELRDMSWEQLRSLRICQEGFTHLHRILCGDVMELMLSKLDELVLLDVISEDETDLICCICGPDWELKTLHVEGHKNLLNCCWPRIRHLKELHLRVYVFAIFKQIFASNPFLERLVLEDCMGTFSPDLDENAAPVAMNHLKTIEFRKVRYPFALTLNIVAPSITHFGMFSMHLDTGVTLLHMASYPSLVELRIVDCVLPANTLPILLPSTPNLETLQVNTIYGVANDMVRFLTRVDSVHGLPCRALKHIDVSYCFDLVTSVVHAFVETRRHYASVFARPSMKKCADIISLKVDGCPNIEREMLPWFRSKVARFSCVYDFEYSEDSEDSEDLSEDE